jgi:hypothetical protein
MRGQAALFAAMLFGKPNNRSAYSGSRKNGVKLPMVITVERKRGGKCLRAKCENMFSVAVMRDGSVGELISEELHMWK